jgi:hypothetical protein
MDVIRRLDKIVRHSMAENDLARALKEQWPKIANKKREERRKKQNDPLPISSLAAPDEARALFVFEAGRRGVPLSNLLDEIGDPERHRMGPSEERLFLRAAIAGAREFARTMVSMDDPRLDVPDHQHPGLLNAMRTQQVKQATDSAERAIRRHVTGYETADDIRQMADAHLRQLVADNQLTAGELARMMRPYGHPGAIGSRDGTVADAIMLKVLATLEVDRLGGRSFAMAMTSADEPASPYMSPHGTEAAAQGYAQSMLVTLEAPNGHTLDILDRETAEDWIDYHAHQPHGTDVRPISLGANDTGERGPGRPRTIFGGGNSALEHVDDSPKGGPPPRRGGR